MDNINLELMAEIAESKGIILEDAVLRKEIMNHMEDFLSLQKNGYDGGGIGERGCMPYVLGIGALCYAMGRTGCSNGMKHGDISEVWREYIYQMNTKKEISI